jgi:hypothetical protein
MKRENRTKRLEQVLDKNSCNICHKRPIEIYQLDYEVCFECHQNESFVSFVDQVHIPEV